MLGESLKQVYNLIQGNPGIKANQLAKKLVIYFLCRRSVFSGRTATEIVDSEHIASQVRLFLQTCDV